MDEMVSELEHAACVWCMMLRQLPLGLPGHNQISPVSTACVHRWRDSVRCDLARGLQLPQSLPGQASAMSADHVSTMI